MGLLVMEAVVVIGSVVACGLALRLDVIDVVITGSRVKRGLALGLVAIGVVVIVVLKVVLGVSLVKVGLGTKAV